MPETDFLRSPQQVALRIAEFPWSLHKNFGQTSHLGADGCILRGNGIVMMREFLSFECGTYLFSAGQSRKEARHGENLA